MPADGTRRALDAAMRHHESGRIADAEKMYRQLLLAEPGNAVLHNLLGIALSQLGRVDEAAASYRQALAQDANFADAHSNLGIALRALGQPADAEQSFRRALALKDDFAQAHNNLGVTLAGLARSDEAEQHYRRAVSIDPRYFDAHFNLAALLRKLGRADQAAQSYRQALALKPEVLSTYGQLALALIDAEQLQEAEQVYRAVLAVAPNHPAAHRELGALYGRMARIAEAEQCYRRALALQPDFAPGHDSLGFLMGYLGRLDESLHHTRQALALQPDFAEAGSHLAFLLNYVPGLGPAEIYAAHRDFGRRFEAGLSVDPHRNAPDPGRRLRIGYVSGDFRNHAVASFIEPVLARHDRARFEIFCYYNFAAVDQVTRRLQAHADHWRQIKGLDDVALAERIRADAIDILVDLSGHSPSHRLTAFARKPAPVQATWLGYLNTTGLEAMDYRITDPRASPDGLLEAYHTEKLIRLPDSQWCYQPPAPCPDVNAPPSAKSGFVTFAAFTGPPKTSRPVIELWCEVLRRVPGSRLMIQIGGFGTMPPDYVERLISWGLPRERVDFVPGRKTLDYFALRNSVDIVLDTFPCTGGTTSCDSLWMGVPVITLVGDTAYSRGGASLLHAIGLDELVAQSADEYVAIAARLAGDAGRLAELRAGLRERMRSSPLMDAERFTRNLETAYRTMWRSWCERAPGR